MSHSLIFVHEGFSSRRGAYLVEKGECRILSRGIYAPTDATEMDVMGDALRALVYRYDGARLMGESARRVLDDGLSPAVLPQKQIFATFATTDGSGRRRERELFPGLSAVLRPEAQSSPFLALSKRMTVDMGHGGTAIWDAPCDAQMLWDAAIAPECAPSPATCMQLLQRIPDLHRNRLLEYPEIRKAALSWESAANGPIGVRIPSLQRVSVFLQDLPVGLLAHDGVSWRMDWAHGRRAPVEDAQWGSTIESLMPEGWQEELESAENVRDPLHFLRQSRRLMNWTFKDENGRVEGVAPRQGCTRHGSFGREGIFNRIPQHAELEQHAENGVFRGTVGLPWADMKSMETMFSVSDVPRISGFQPKVAGFLDADGHLSVSDAESPFTVLMKIDPREFGLQKMEGIPVLEWACQNAARHAGLETANCALALDTDGNSAMLLSERFDSPRYGDYDRYDIALDGAVALGLHTGQKYNVSTAKLWKGFLEKGLPPQEAEKFFDRFVAAWVMADGDLHIKNISMIFSSHNDGQNRFGPWTARIAPAYDMVCTRAFDSLKNDNMASVIEGKQDDLRMKTWKTFGARTGIPEVDAENRVLRIAVGIAEGLAAMAGHPVLATLAGCEPLSREYGATCRTLLEKSAEIARTRALALGVSAADIHVPRAEHLGLHLAPQYGSSHHARAAEFANVDSPDETDALPNEAALQAAALQDGDDSGCRDA